MTDSCLFANPQIDKSPISEQQFDELLELQSSILGAAVSASDSDELLGKTCQLAEKLVAQSVASIMLYDPQQKQLFVRAGPSLPPAAVEALNGLNIGEGSCGNVVYHGDVMYVCNTHVDARWENIREFAERFKICACWASPVRNVDGEVIGSFAISSFETREPTLFQTRLLDICSSIAGILIEKEQHRQRQLELEQEHLKRQKLESISVLAGGIAHDFNNLLGVIVGGIDMTRRSTEIESQTVSLLDSADTATRSAISLTRQLLTFARGGDPVKHAASIASIIRESAEFVMHGSNVALEFDIDQDDCPEQWLAEVDSGQISQVIQNLTLNARQSMPDGGVLIISCQHTTELPENSMIQNRDGTFIRIEVRDTGTGISESLKSKIFDPYFTTKENGNGLGLAMSHSIVNRHGGDIFVESKEGEGSRFIVYLPALTGVSESDNLATSGTAVDDITPDDERRTRKGRVLVMDDQEMVRVIAHAMLESMGFDVVYAEEGDKAVQLYKQSLDTDKPIDLTIMDLTIPGGMGGREAVNEILKIDPHAKVIVSSGYSVDPVMENYREYGFKAAVSKPYSYIELENVVHSLT